MTRRAHGTGALSRGYIIRRIAGKCILEHRLVWQQHFGPIPAGHVIHHKNHNKSDNRIENLELMEHRAHTLLHAKDRPKRQKAPCSVAGCEGFSWARGWCRKHYLRWYYNGTLEKLKPKPVAERRLGRAPNGKFVSLA